MSPYLLPSWQPWLLRLSSLDWNGREFTAHRGTTLEVPCCCSGVAPMSFAPRGTDEHAIDRRQEAAMQRDGPDSFLGRLPSRTGLHGIRAPLERGTDLVGGGAMHSLGFVPIFPRRFSFPWLWASREQTSCTGKTGSRRGYLL